MMIIQVDRSHDNEQRKLFSDECHRIVGIRQETYRARPILYVHTALRWESAQEELPDNPIEITGSINHAIEALNDAASIIRHALPQDTSRTLRLGQISMAVSALQAIQATEMPMKAGKWISITEAADRRKRLAKAANAGQPPTGFALAMRVLHSDLYRELNDLARGECDALIEAGQRAQKIE